MSNTITRGKAKVGAGTLVVIGSASATTVEIRIQNESGGTRDFAAGAWSVTVVRFA